MDLLTIQQNVKEFIKDKGINDTIDVRLIDLVSEVGELSKELMR